MNHKEVTIKEFMLNFDQMIMVEEKQQITKELIESISDTESGFILIYREKKENVIGYVKVK